MSRDVDLNSLNESDEEAKARFERAQAVGLATARAVMLLNSGAFVVILTYIASATTNAAIVFETLAIKRALVFFLLGIVLVLAALMLSYAHEGTEPERRFKQWTNRRIVECNIVLVCFSVVSFCVGVLFLIFSAQPN